jgi:hypothetical protein
MPRRGAVCPFVVVDVEVSVAGIAAFGGWKGRGGEGKVVEGVFGAGRLDLGGRNGVVREGWLACAGGGRGGGVDRHGGSEYLCRLSIWSDGGRG